MSTAEKIYTLDQLTNQVEEWKRESQKIVFTNGCFDLLHLGHVDYLEKAAALGDRLVIGLNSDSSVSALKGPNRPVNDEYARARVLAALAFTDAICLFDQNTPYELIKGILPDILVKGGDYQISNIVGADIVMDNGGKVLTLPVVEGYSTTAIINKNKQ